ncbi:MAG: DUF1080 domain-containing protein [Pirellulales bacterium]|nr:DUF1080 domain-containing protein [Pirellulales bacterium]
MNWLTVLLSSAAIFGGSLSNASELGTNSARALPEAFTSLFNGKDLSGWYATESIDPKVFFEVRRARGLTFAIQDKRRIVGQIKQARSATPQTWNVEDGVITGKGSEKCLTTDEHFEDFELRLEYLVSPGAHGGIHLKGSPQVKIWDPGDQEQAKLGANKGSGGLFSNPEGASGRVPLVVADKPTGQWNVLRIIQVGARTSVWLNGKLVVNHAIMENAYWKPDPKRPLDTREPLIITGPIRLQALDGPIRWRNVAVRRIEPEEAVKILTRNADAEGFDSLFNGKDFSGWEGTTEDFEIIDGVLRNKVDNAGTMYTKDVFSDYVLRFELNVPPYGRGPNNGIGVHYPGASNHYPKDHPNRKAAGRKIYDASKAGMCEIQILDNTHQYHRTIGLQAFHLNGSAYGLLPAARNYHVSYTGARALRASTTAWPCPTDADEWNFWMLTVRGSKLKLEQNGRVILDQDIANVTQEKLDRVTDELYGARPRHRKPITLLQAQRGIARRSGHIALVGHKAPIGFRNILIKQLDDETK